MEKNEMLNKIEYSIKEGKKCRIYFKDVTRSPIIGKFVKLGDHRFVESKGGFRFVSDSKELIFDSCNEIQKSAYTQFIMLNVLTTISLHDSSELSKFV